MIRSRLDGILLGLLQEDGLQRRPLLRGYVLDTLVPAVACARRLLLFKIHLGLLCLAVFLVVAGLRELAPLAVHRLVVVLVATIFMFVLLSLEFGLKAASESKYDDEDGNNR